MIKFAQFQTFLFAGLLAFLMTGCDLDSSSGEDLVSQLSEQASSGSSSSSDSSEDATPSQASSGGGNDIDPSTVIFQDEDVSGWAQTATLNAGVSGGTAILNYDKARVWPTANTRANDGGPLNANCWVVVNVGGQWYAATFDWLRTGQTSKAASAVTGANGHIVGAPLNSWRPSSGERIGFMVTTPARGGERTLNERSNISEAIWP